MIGYLNGLEVGQRRNGDDPQVSDCTDTGGPIPRIEKTRGGEGLRRKMMHPDSDMTRWDASMCTNCVSINHRPYKVIYISPGIRAHTLNHFLYLILTR